MSESTSGDVRTQAVRRIVAGAVALEAVVLAGSGVFLAIDTVTRGAADTLASWVIVGMAILVAGLLAAAVPAVMRGRRGARAPLLVWQFMQAGVTELTKDTAWLPLGVALLVLAVIVLIGSFVPGVYEEDVPSRD